MDDMKRKKLESAGWKLGDAADFLEMSDEERQLLDARRNGIREEHDIENGDYGKSEDRGCQPRL